MSETEYPSHVLIATRDGEDDLAYEVECSAADHYAAACAMWRECGCSVDDFEKEDDPDEAPEETAEDALCPKTGHEHRLCGFGLAVPSGECFVACNDNLADAASDLNITEPGRYELDYDVQDETDLYLMLAAEQLSA